MPSLRISFIIGAVLSGIAAVLSAMRGQKYVHEIHGPANGAPKPAAVSADGGAEDEEINGGPGSDPALNHGDGKLCLICSRKY